MPDTPQKDTVYFYKFNNYYNRIIKRYDTIAEYGDPLGTQTNANFVHADGINTSFTFNKGMSLVDTPDYVIVLDYNNDISRWFVTNSYKNRSGQDSLTLRRDLIADFYSDIIKYSPCLIRKGYVPQSNPLIFNDEGVKYNKIKREEIMIKDESNCSYIVGFIANNATAIPTITGTIKADNYDFSYASLSDFPLHDYVEGAGNNHTESARIAINNNFSGRVFYGLKYSWKSKATTRTGNSEIFFNAGGWNLPTGVIPSYSSVEEANKMYYNESAMENTVRLQGKIGPITETDFGLRDIVIRKYYEAFKEKINLNYVNIVSNAKAILQLNESKYAELAEYNGKRIKVGSTIYKCTLISSSPVTIDRNSVNFPSSAWSDLATAINRYIPTSTELSQAVLSYQELEYISNSTKEYTANDLRVICQTQQVYLQFAEEPVDITTSLDSPSNRTHLIEQPFDMFCLINESNISYKVGVNNYVSNHEVNLNMAIAICEATGGSALDIQVVPFNPIQGAILADGTINWLNYDSHEIKDTNNNVVGHYVMCSSADFKLVLNKDELKFHPENYKKDFNLNQYRLCSPNQETVFDFSPSMNDGIDTWEVTVNYRPYASYIKIQPTWKNMYGEAEYNGKTDFRGLVYNSSLCVTQLNNEWSNYVSNNKNFQQLFDNQINTLTKSQQIQLSAMEDTLGWRSYTGMPISSIARVVGGMRDIDMQRELNNVALNKMESDFKYQMDNIQSMPHTIKKLTNINGDTRVFPYIEIYSCSEEEEESFDLKMRYTGYTIMTTGYIWNYLQLGVETFVQADLIRLDLSRSEETADNHMAVEIAAELEKGIFITKESE